jgi:tight adherence protein B
VSVVAGALAALALVVALRPQAPARRRHDAAATVTAPIRPTGRVHPDDVAAWMADLSRRVRAGTTLRAALDTVVPADPTLARLTDGLRHELARGATTRAAVDALPAEDPHLGLARSVIRVCVDVGGATAEPLDRAATTLRGRGADLAERAAQSAQARLSARVMTTLPLAALALLVLSDSDVRRVVGSPIGQLCLLAGGVANGLGWWWMNRTVRAHQWAG